MKPTLPRVLKIGLWLLLAMPLIYIAAKAAQPAGFAAVRLREQLLAYAALQAMWLLWMSNRLPAAPNATRALIAGTPAWVGALANTVLAGVLLWARLAAPQTLAQAGLTEFGMASPFLLALFALATLAALAVRAVPAGQPLGQTWRAWAVKPLDWHDDLFSPRAAAIAVWVLFAVGVAIRLVNLGGFPPYPDEDNHTSTALELLRTGTTTYTRSLLTVTLPVLVSFKLLGVSWFEARLPMVLLSMASVWPLYAIASRVNRSVGVLAAFLFAISPWMITAGGPGTSLLDLGEGEDSNLATGQVMTEMRRRFLRRRQAAVQWLLADVLVHAWRRYVLVRGMVCRPVTAADLRVEMPDISVEDNRELATAAAQLARALTDLSGITGRGPAFRALALRWFVKFLGEPVAAEEMEAVLAEGGEEGGSGEWGVGSREGGVGSGEWGV